MINRFFLQGWMILNVFLYERYMWVVSTITFYIMFRALFLRKGQRTYITSINPYGSCLYKLKNTYKTFMLLLSSPLSIHWRRVVGEVRCRLWASVPGEKNCLNLGARRNIGKKMSYMEHIWYKAQQFHTVQRKDASKASDISALR